MTAVIALVYLRHISVSMTLVASVILIFFRRGTRKAFATIRPIFRSDPRSTRKSPGGLPNP